MVKGEFTIPVKEQTAQQNAPPVRFWCNKDILSLQRGMLSFKGKPIVKKSSLKGVVEKVLKSQGQGNYTTNSKILAVAFPSGMFMKSSQNPKVHQKLRFENRARLRPIHARNVQIRHQIDLVDMEKLKTKHKGKVFKYVLSVMDVFSRYQWLVPLE